jgi:hypothetical protein
MTSSPPRRRFLPEPVEITAKSSRQLKRGDPETQLADRIPDQNSAPSRTPGSLLFDQMKTITTTQRPLPQPAEIPSRSTNNSNEKETGSSRDNEVHIHDHLPCGTAEGSKVGKNGPRRFLAQPIETTTKSSKKFAPELVETSTNSTRRRNGDKQAEGGETPQSTRRRYTPDLVETTTTISRKKPSEANKESEALQTRRRFVPAPIETTTKSNRSKHAPATVGSQSEPQRRKFAPEPVETSVRRRRKQNTEEDPEASSSDEKSAPRSSHSISSPRKFSPELIETARGSFKKGDSSPRPSRSETTDLPIAVPRYLRPPLAPSNTPSHSDAEVPQIHESRFSAASLARRQTRQHSFIIPELPCIESDSSEENSAVPSLSTSPSVSSEESSNRQGNQEVGEGHEGNFQGYMLSLAAQAAEKQLRDQAMAAYPNEQVHEPVHHFAVEDSDEESASGKLEGNNGIDPKIFRRESGADLAWHMHEMRRHHEQLEEAKRALKEDTAGQSRFSAAALLARHKTQAKKEIGGNQKGVGLAEMRNAASPPMLGDDLVFPLSISPKMTRCDVDQVPVPRSHEREENGDYDGEAKLWSAHIGLENNAEAGLWMGLCQKKDCEEQFPPTPMRSGLMTPAVQVDDVEAGPEPNHTRGFDKQDKHWLCSRESPAILQADPFTQSIDDKLNRELDIERQIEQEFHHGFITQIYNYLSLGYPSLAHNFDHELSKITRTSVEELRKDDELADAKGYVGAPEGEGLDENSAKEGKCARWTALRLYIHEWARQQPGMADRAPNEWGVRARRGSWAF